MNFCNQVKPNSDIRGRKFKIPFVRHPHRNLKSVVEAIKVLELLDDSDEVNFINGSTAFDPLVENQVNGGLGICDPRNPTVEAVE